jgi:hypothetical protein
MSIVFSDTTNKNGIMQLIEKNCGFSDGDITGNATRLAQFTGDVNLAVDELLGFMFPLGGTWQLDDSNHTDYPFIETDLISGQRDYSFTTDGSGNVVLDIYKVMVKNPEGVYHEITPQDQQSDGASSFYDGSNTTGTPTRYDKTGNGIFLDFIPNYNWRTTEEGEKGLKVFINREASKFSASDTTKKLGFAHLFHEYLALAPSYRYGYRNSLATTKSLDYELQKMTKAIKDYFGTREKDVRRRLKANVENTR